MSLLVNRCLDYVLPRACVACGFDSGQANLCRVCSQYLPWMGPACPRCALPLAEGGDSVCGSCQVDPPPFETSHAPLVFDFPVNRLVHAFKFRRDTAAGHALAELLCTFMAAQCAAGVQVMPALWVPVPMHRRRLARRMLNPAFFLAWRLARHSNLPLAPHRLQRSRHTPTQTGLAAAERKKNLTGAFCWKGESLDGTHVGLVDDVMTTGSTVRECARVLRRSGASRISVWVLARALSS